MSETNERGFSPIGEKFLNRRDLFGLKFAQGYVFLEVESKEYSRYAPFSDVEYNGTAGDPIPANTSTVFQTLEDSGDEILHIDGRASEKVIHASIGQYPSAIRRYANYPEASNRMNQIDNLSAPRRGDPYGYIDGKDSPYESPSDAQELVIPPEVSLDFAFHNSDNKERTPMLNINMMTYTVNVINPRENRDTVSRILSPGSPMPIYPVGTGFDQIDYELAWDVDPVSRNQIGGN